MTVVKRVKPSTYNIVSSARKLSGESNRNEMSKKSWLAGLLLLLPFSLTACSTSITAIHDPLYRASTHTSNITAIASNNSVGIKQIRIEVTTGEMTDCTELGGAASVIPCRKNATTITHTCNYSGGPSTATCNYSQALGNQAMVTYRATAKPVSGSSRNSEEITYAGGFPPVAGIARPVWWHRGQPMGGKIDVGFFPDADYSGNYTEFTEDLEVIAKGAFFNGGQDFASIYTFFRPSVNLWAAPFGADAQGNSRSFNALVSPIVAVMNGQAIVHKDNFRDFAAITLGGAGSVWAKAGDPDWLFVHESGHFLHGQGDEYFGGGNSAAGSCKNVFSSQASCQSAASSAGADPNDCVEITSGTTKTGAWRNDEGQLETMEDRTDSSNWRNNSAQCVVQRFINCGSGSCY